MITVIECERNKVGTRLDKSNSVFLLFSGVNHDWEGDMVHLDGIYNSLAAAQNLTGIPTDEWTKTMDGRHKVVIYKLSHREFYVIVKCQIGEICNIGMSYEELFG